MHYLFSTSASIISLYIWDNLGSHDLLRSVIVGITNFDIIVIEFSIDVIELYLSYSCDNSRVGLVERLILCYFDARPCNHFVFFLLSSQNVKRLFSQFLCGLKKY